MSQFKRFDRSLFTESADGTLVAEASTLGSTPNIFEIDGITYVFYKRDKDPSNEDDVGYRYRNETTGKQVLIIND